MDKQRSTKHTHKIKDRVTRVEVWSLYGRCKARHFLYAMYPVIPVSILTSGKVIQSHFEFFEKV